MHYILTMYSYATVFFQKAVIFLLRKILSIKGSFFKKDRKVKKLLLMSEKEQMKRRGMSRFRGRAIDHE